MTYLHHDMIRCVRSRAGNGSSDTLALDTKIPRWAYRTMKPWTNDILQTVMAEYTRVLGELHWIHMCVLCSRHAVRGHLSLNLLALVGNSYEAMGRVDLFSVLMT